MSVSFNIHRMHFHFILTFRTIYNGNVVYVELVLFLLYYYVLFWRRCIGILFFLNFCVYSSRIHGVLNFVNPTNRLTCELTIFKSEKMYTKLITSANFVFFLHYSFDFFFFILRISRWFHVLIITFFLVFGMNENKTPDTLGYSYTTRAYS